MSKYLFYLICKLAMNTSYEDYDTKLDKILLIVRRSFLILFVWFILFIILFKIIWINKNSWININWYTSAISWDILNVDQIKTKKISNNNINKNIQQDLGKHYSKDNKYIYYKGDVISFVDVDKFYVIDDNWRYSTTWLIITSNNLLKIFANYDTRAYMMKQIDGIIKNEKNITSKLKLASENWLYKMSLDIDVLSKFDRNDRYDMTDTQRAKFAIMFLYIKIAKSMHNNEISMKVALNELKYFLENFDKNSLSSELKDKNMNKIRGNIWLDDHCIYKNWKLYACFLDKIFIK